MDHLTAEQWRGWEKFYEQEPWGDLRQDMRTLAQSLVVTGADTDVSLIFPYWDSSEEMFAKHKELEARTANPELMAKLKAARERHRTEHSRGA